MKGFMYFCFAGFGFLFGEISYSVEQLDEVTFAQILRVSPKEYQVKVLRANKHMDKTREGVDSMARREGAIAAVNGGFYHENGDPAGALKIDGKWVGYSTRARGALGWDKGRQKFTIESIFASDRGKVELHSRSSSNAKDWEKLDYIVGGVPILIQNNKILEDFSSETSYQKFLTQKNRRSAVGILEDGTLIFVVISSPYSKLQIKSFKASKVWEHDPGITLQQLAQYMQKLGCKDALNLCGASSSAMFVDKSKVDVFIDYQSTLTKPVSDVIAIMEK